MNHSHLPFIAVIALLVVIDLQGVDSRYLNKDNYVRNAQALAMQPAQYDRDIDAYALQFGDQDYRVFNMAVNTFNDSKPSAFHNQIGGYSAAKLRRYQDLIDFYLSYNINPQVLNMLNTRYIVLRDGHVQRNPDALGNCWFVRDVKSVDSPNDEILSLNDFNPATTAIINTSEFAVDRQSFTFDSTATITMEHKHPTDLNCLTYRSHSATDQLAVFSEIFYSPDWKAYIDGKPADYFRANYILRAMVIPAGNHLIEFRNEAPTLHKMDNITLAFSVVMVLIIAATLILFYRKKRKSLNLEP